MRRFITFFISSILLFAHSKAMSLESDSLCQKRLSTWQRFERSSMGQATMISVPLIVGGFIIKTQDNHFRSLRNGYLPKFDNQFENYLQYAPAAAMLSMKIAGVKSYSSWSEMLTADAVSVALMGGIIQLMKRTIDSERPDGTSHTSFPSGHTATAFMTATMLHHEYGYKHPWISVAGYGCAAMTGFMRLVNNRHWLSDVMVGAGIGIMSAEFGYLISDLIFHKRSSLENQYFNQVAIRDWRPSFIGLYLSYTKPLSTYYVDNNTSLKASSGCSIGLEGAWFFNHHLGIGGKGTISSVRFIANNVMPSDKDIRYESMMAGLYVSLPFSKRVSIGTKALCGVNHYNTIKYKPNPDEENRLNPSWGVEFGTGVSLSVRIQKMLSYKIFCDLNSLPPLCSSFSHRNLELNAGATFALTF